MKRKIAPTTLLVVFVTLGLGVAATARAHCSQARAAGTYGFSSSGTVIGVGPRVPPRRLS